MKEEGGTCRLGGREKENYKPPTIRRPDCTDVVEMRKYMHERNTERRKEGGMEGGGREKGRRE